MKRAPAVRNGRTFARQTDRGYASSIPAIRVRRCNDAPMTSGSAFVLYWMIGARRTRWNFGLQRAAELSRAHGLPLLVLEPLRVGYRWASARLHRFVVDGMIHNQARLRERGVPCYSYVEPQDGAGKGLLDALAEHAAVVVTDDFPAFFLPRMVHAAARRIGVRIEAVDGNGLLPLDAASESFATAYAFRRFLHRELPAHLEAIPHSDPLDLLAPAEERHASVPSPPSPSPAANVSDLVPARILERWPVADLSDPAELVRRLPIDHSVPPVDLTGGSEAAEARLAAFADGALDRYVTDANRPEREGTSGLSPYLHFGHISAHQVFHRVAELEGWTAARLAGGVTGRRVGWWGVGKGAEAFLDQLVTWRELGFVRCRRTDRYDAYDALPDWARTTLAEHASDPREFVYGLREFERARTHDPLWNAAQNQLLREGRIHNYLRMLWGKKILEWSESPREAFRVMTELNNKYALDGRDPNSWTGILWVLGLHDRPWGPERPVFGKIRYMSSANTAKKYRVRRFVERYASP